jgi:SpoVK/Ycf46/Vps4 family AAA+-type ATPase
MNYDECLKVTKRYLLARIPFISYTTVEKNRALDLITKVYEDIKIPIFVHSMSKGVYNIQTKELLSEEKTIMGVLDYIADQFKTRENLTFVLTEATDINEDSLVSRYMMDVISLAEEKGGTILVITSDPVWTHLQRLGMNITMSLPTEEEIYKIIKENIDYYRNQIKIEWDDENYKEAATILTGISEIEIKNVLSSLVAKGEIVKQDLVDLKFAKDRLFSNINGLEKIDMEGFNSSFAGLDVLYKWLMEKKELLLPSKKEELKKRNIRPPRGILLVGVPGCGKSLSAKVIANTWELPLYRLDFATVQGRYVGQSEQQLKDALETAEHVSPCILWIDEIEKGLVNDGGDSGVTTRMVGQFLFWLQECEKDVFVIATANDVTKLPSELLRKGRFDELFFVDLPTVSERFDILKMYIKKYLNIDPPEPLLQELVKITEGFSGADLEASIRDISYRLIAEPDFKLTGQTIIDSLNKVVPMVKTNPEKVNFIRSWGHDRAQPASSRKE